MSIFVDIEKRMGDFQLKVKFQAENEVLALFGASGCGKSVTLKCIAGIETPDRGKIILNGRTLFDSEKNINLPPQKRKAGLLFQNYALFPNMTVRENISAGAHSVKEKLARKKLVEEALRTFELTELAEHYPSQLSGGQQQRTALARILVSEPEILLLDEPFSALDSHLRFQTEQEVRKVIQRFQKTVIFVSHDRNEVFRLSNSVAIMERGAIDSFGWKEDIFAHPSTPTAALLTGCRNISPVKILDESHVEALDWGLTLKTMGDLKGVTHVGIRSQDLISDFCDNTFNCQIIDMIENPFSYTLLCQAVGSSSRNYIEWEFEKRSISPASADVKTFSLPPEKLLLLKGL